MPDWLVIAREVVVAAVAVVFGFGLATWWDRRKEKHDRERRELDTINSLLEELRDDVMIPEANFTPSAAGDGSVEVDMEVPFVSTSAFTAAVSSGNIALLPPALQTTLFAFYGHARLVEPLVENITQSHARGLSVEEEINILRNSHRHVRAHCEMLNEEMVSVRTELQEAKKAYKAA